MCGQSTFDTSALILFETLSSSAHTVSRGQQRMELEADDQKSRRVALDMRTVDHQIEFEQYYIHVGGVKSCSFEKRRYLCVPCPSGKIHKYRVRKITLVMLRPWQVGR